MSSRNLIYGIVFILYISCAYSLKYTQDLDFYKDDNANIIKQDYFQEYIDYQLEKINSTTYALHWVNTNDWLFKNLTAKTPAEAGKNTDFEAYSRYAFPDKNPVTVADDSRYLKIKDEFPQQVVKGNAKIRGKVKPMSQKYGTVYIDYDPNTYSLVSIGFGTLLIEFTTSEQSVQTDLGFNYGFYRNMTRFIKLPYLSTIKNATLNIYGFERNYSIWSEFDYFENSTINYNKWNYSFSNAGSTCYTSQSIIENTRLKLDTSCGGSGSPVSANSIISANNTEDYGYVNITKKNVSIYIKYSAIVSCQSVTGTDAASGGAYIQLYNMTDTLNLRSTSVSCYGTQTKSSNTGVKYVNIMFNTSSTNISLYDETGKFITNINISSLGGDKYLYLRAASSANRQMGGAAGAGQLNIYDIGMSYNSSDYFIFNRSATYPTNMELIVGDEIAQKYSNLSKNIKINFTTNLTNAMNNGQCNCTGCYIQNENCYVPIIVKSDHGGGINISNVSVDYIYDYNLTLIDEIDNTLFNVTNLSICKAYWDDNSTAYDFKAAGNVSNFQFQAALGSKIRIELGYYGSAIINRYIDVSLFNTSIRVCANKDDVTHYEQRLQSNIQRKAMLRSQYSNCYVVADYTRFARENLLEVRTFTIDRPYDLYTDVDGVHTLISSLDGGVPDNTNIDTLEFALDDYTITILQPTLSFRKIEGLDETIQILYKNSRQDNDNLRIKITNTDTGSIAYNGAGFSDPNDVTLNFDYGGLNYTNNTLFKIVVTANENTESESTITRWFTPNLNVGIFRAEFGMIGTILLMLFGFTIIRSKDTLGWFGLVVSLTNIAILSLCITTWYTTFMMAIYIIIALFTLVLLFTTNKVNSVVS